ncbi:hypothetical protein CVT25_015772 [Psilocybe cyanescens]|uniref:Uncharacterized protein n=1 Tax=Psilocybe cyanescens TaxID=93625 RepID=A0A409X1F8_PSICY|nr:hypothetical protein CVT25_015772 [Psilocybe cyanescens]
MAPTVLITRIALTKPTCTVGSVTITHSSSLQFGSQQRSGSGRSGIATGEDINDSVQTHNAEPIPMIKLKRESLRAEVAFGEISLGHYTVVNPWFKLEPLRLYRPLFMSFHDAGSSPFVNT